MIETERLLLKKISEEDIDLIFEINNDPGCIEFNGWDSMSLEKCKDVIDNWIDKYKNSELIGVFCVKYKDTNDKIGMAYIIDYKEPNQFEIGFRLRSACWNRGYAKEITQGFTRYAENKLKANEVVAEVFRGNLRSRNVFEKLGFEESVHPDGEDGLIYRHAINKGKRLG
ncbi:GNAT family N-acetyltransferase [Tissierella sp. MB52-C2]|uniref:GNAT family N-acetyltransferase n=1 Tax=Tissierella sp. MB52-C2 TaxID=3070999 RepID=UPI00280B0BD0|nr:GNAT family N-acetyltransferase [Tissierella sp. MB52-C2]WMM23804.1 GNAT family N-acetyltransferase [Tissierella sp. MB52-C2]